MPYLTRTILQQEAAWSYTAWQPVIADAATFNTWLDTIVQRASDHTKWRVGSTVYATTDTSLQAILKEAELCLAQYYLLLAAASIADTSDDSQTVGGIAHGNLLREDAKSYLDRYAEIIGPHDTQPRAGTSKATALAGDNLAANLPPFDNTVDWERRN